jgi:flagellar biosynthesis/type III secretory pathway M-ring protein FliF/YscJ
MDPLFAVVVGLVVLGLLVWLSLRLNRGDQRRRNDAEDSRPQSRREAREERDRERKRNDDDNDGGATGSAGIYY